MKTKSYFTAYVLLWFALSVIIAVFIAKKTGQMSHFATSPLTYPTAAALCVFLPLPVVRFIKKIVHL